jgi:hypothetical protein
VPAVDALLPVISTAKSLATEAALDFFRIAITSGSSRSAFLMAIRDGEMNSRIGRCVYVAVSACYVLRPS